MHFLTPLILLLALPASAQTVVERMTCGAISGTVVDYFGDPLPGANVFVEGTRLGAATNFDGEYRIDCVPPGPHDVTASFVGYTQAKVEGVEVLTQRERSLAFTLGEGMVLCAPITTGERPLFPRDPYAARVLTGEEIERLPVGR